MSEPESEQMLTVKRSKFHAVYQKATSMDEVKALLAKRRRKLRKANHHCWACRILEPSGRWLEQARDDGEVGRPGHVLLELLRKQDAPGFLIVSRIYGGVKLGPGGVARAFREAGRAALESHEGAS
jgi:putative IMPACT (imprinted ancient) family translation regulator